MSENSLDGIRELINNPDTRKMLMNLMGSLGSNNTPQQAPVPAPPPEAKSEDMPEIQPTPMTGTPTQAPAQEGSSNRISLDETVNKMMQIKQVYDKINTQPDHRVTLLSALRPYLNSKRMGKIDTAIQMVQLTKLTKMFQEFK